MRLVSRNRELYGRIVTGEPVCVLVFSSDSESANEFIIENGRLSCVQNGITYTACTTEDGIVVFSVNPVDGITTARGLRVVWTGSFWIGQTTDNQTEDGHDIVLV
jgi:hypothetical protein